MISAVGVNRVLTVDLHAEQIQGFFSIPVDNVYGSPVLTEDIERQRYENLTVVSPDVGGVVRARAVAKQLNVDLAIIDKRRPTANDAQVMNIIGDVEGRSCLIVDDMVDTAGTLCKAAEALKDHGAQRVMAYATHPILSGPAIEKYRRFGTGLTGGYGHNTVVGCSQELRPHTSAVHGKTASRIDKARQ